MSVVQNVKAAEDADVFTAKDAGLGGFQGRVFQKTKDWPRMI